MHLASILAVLLIAHAAFAQAIPEISAWRYWQRESGTGSAQQG